jgi:hypothetical protein
VTKTQCLKENTVIHITILKTHFKISEPPSPWPHPLREEGREGEGRQRTMIHITSNKMTSDGLELIEKNL